jgi:hypothetical protein
MSGSDDGRKEPEPLEVEDPRTGERYLMYPLKVAWPSAVLYVYECQTCQGRYPPQEWSAGCPGCCGYERKHKRKRRKRRD